MIHVIPLNDLMEHEEETTCPCRPRVDFTEGEGVVIHNAYDGRELLEEEDDLT